MEGLQYAFGHSLTVNEYQALRKASGWPILGRPISASFPRCRLRNFAELDAHNWSLPFAVLTAVPFGVFGALVATWLRGLENDVYFKSPL